MLLVGSWFVHYATFSRLVKHFFLRHEKLADHWHKLDYLRILVVCFILDRGSLRKRFQFNENFVSIESFGEHVLIILL